MMRTFLYLSVMHLSIFRIQGYPSRAGSCHSGNAIPNYSPHPDVSSGELAAAGINVFIGDDQLSPSEPYSLRYGETEMNVLSIQSSSGFAGFLMRGSSSTGLDAPYTVTPIFTIDPSTQIEQNLSSCESQSPQASGVTHVNNDMKTYVEANIANPVVDVIDLEVTVMVNVNEYYYSKFSVDFIDDSIATPTIASSSNPSLSISTVPSLSPSAIASTPPSSSPTSSISTVPSLSPSTIASTSPSSSPTSSTSTAPSLSPNASASIPPTSSPTKPISTVPSPSPSTPPTSSPTSSISTEPSPSPRTSATNFPSSTPTSISSVTPTSYHSMIPSVSSSASPTSSSSQTPSISPSVTPSGSPVVLVSAIPTAKAPIKTPVNIINPSPSGPPIASPTSSSGYYLRKLSGNELTNVFWGVSILFIAGFV